MSRDSFNPYEAPALDDGSELGPTDLFWFRVWTVSVLGAAAFSIGMQWTSARKWSIGEWLSSLAIGVCGCLLTQYVWFWWQPNDDEVIRSND